MVGIGAGGEEDRGPRPDLGLPITAAVAPLRTIFWGGLLLVLDFHFTSTTTIDGGAPRGFRFDILNDLIGVILIVVGVFRLARFEVDETYRVSIRFALVCAGLGCFPALLDHFIFPRPTLLELVLASLSLATLVAVVLFCHAMFLLSERAGLRESAARWRTTRLLAIALWLVPLGLLHATSILAMLTGSSWNFDPGPVAILALLAMLVPLIHFFIATSGMRREAEERTGACG